MMTILNTTTQKPEAPLLQAVPRGRNLISIASGKGGVGKTWFAVTLAHALARADQRVLLFDGDLGLANIDIQLGLVPEVDLGDALRGERKLEQVITRFEDGGKAGCGFDVIAGKSGSGALGSLRPQALEALKDDIIRISAPYSHVLLDLSAGIDAGVRSLCAHDGRILVVVTPDPTSITDAYAFIKLQHMDRPNSDIRVVVNMADDRMQGKRTFDTLKRACEGFLKVTPKLAGMVRRDRNVTDAIRHQTSMLTRHPLTAAAQDVEAIVSHLLETPKPAARAVGKTVKKI
jgi:flagellar biosynthesis protein FlhG